MVKKHIVIDKTFHSTLALKKRSLQKTFPDYNWTFAFMLENAFACWEKHSFELKQKRF